MYRLLRFIALFFLTGPATGQTIVIDYTLETNFGGNTVHQHFVSHNTSLRRLDEFVRKEMVFEDHQHLGFNTEKTPPPFVHEDRRSGQTVSLYTYLNKFDVVTEATPTQSWQLLDTSMVILGLPCRGARATFRGRDYFAWYTNRLGLTGGIYKFSGLPGFVLAASSADGIVHFSPTRIVRFPETHAIVADYPASPIPYAAFTRKYRDWQERVLRFVRARDDGETTHEVDFHSVEIHGTSAKR